MLTPGGQEVHAQRRHDERHILLDRERQQDGQPEQRRRDQTRHTRFSDPPAPDFVERKRAEKQERLERFGMEVEARDGLERGIHQVREGQRERSPRPARPPGREKVHEERAGPDGQALQGEQRPRVAPHPVDRGKQHENELQMCPEEVRPVPRLGRVGEEPPVRGVPDDLVVDAEIVNGRIESGVRSEVETRERTRCITPPSRRARRQVVRAGTGHEPAAEVRQSVWCASPVEPVGSSRCVHYNRRVAPCQKPLTQSRNPGFGRRHVWNC